MPVKRRMADAHKVLVVVAPQVGFDGYLGQVDDAAKHVRGVNQNKDKENAPKPCRPRSIHLLQCGADAGIKREQMDHGWRLHHEETHRQNVRDPQPSAELRLAFAADRAQRNVNGDAGRDDDRGARKELPIGNNRPIRTHCQRLAHLDADHDVRQHSAGEQ